MSEVAATGGFGGGRGRGRGGPAFGSGCDRIRTTASDQENTISNATALPTPSPPIMTVPPSPSGLRGRGRGGPGVYNFGRGNTTTAANQDQQQQKENNNETTEAPPSVGGRGRGRGGVSFGGGTQFGDRNGTSTDEPQNNETTIGAGRGNGRGRGRGGVGTGANTAPLGGGTGGGFGLGRGRGGLGRGGGGAIGLSGNNQPDEVSNSNEFLEASTNRGRGSGLSGRGGAGFGQRGGAVGVGGGDRGEDADTIRAGRPFHTSTDDERRNIFRDRDDRSSQPLTDEERKIRNYKPIDRPISEIVEEDLKVADRYKTISDEDVTCVVTGLPDGTSQQVVDIWEHAEFDKKLMDNIARSQYILPRKIQSLSIPVIMAGLDVKGHAETGSGKSAAFLLPIINIVIQKKRSGEYKPKRSYPFAVILEPTRELAYQLYDQARKLAEGTGVTVSKAYGKFKRMENAREISIQGCDILIGTPGRLYDFFFEKYLEFDNFKILVMDEADQLLEEDNVRLIRQMTKINGWPKNDQRQTLLFSATFPPEVQEWANDWLKKDNVMVSNSKLLDANPRVIQEFMIVGRTQKTHTLENILKKEEEEAKRLDPADPKVKRTMVFVETKRGADVVSTYLNECMLKSTTINGDRTQAQREESLYKFRKGEFNIVVTTDVCARGLDIKNMDFVINYDLPSDIKTYVHRIGRTGRLEQGIALSFFDPDDDMPMAKELVNSVRNVNQTPPQWLVEASEGKMPASDAAADGGWGGSGMRLGGISMNGVKPEGPYIPKHPMKDLYHGVKGKENTGVDNEKGTNDFDGAEDW